MAYCGEGAQNLGCGRFKGLFCDRLIALQFRSGEDDDGGGVPGKQDRVVVVCVCAVCEGKKGMTTLLLNKFFMGWEGRAVVEKSKIVKREILIYFSLLRNESEPFTRMNEGLTEM